MSESTRYTDTGLWVTKKKDSYLIGLSKMGQDEAGEISYVDLNVDNQTIATDEVLLSVEGDKAVTEFTTPFSLTVIKWHEALEHTPEILNQTNQADRWILEGQLISDDEFKRLKKDEKIG